MDKSPDAFRTISEVADWLDTPAHVLRFWESRFTQVKPVKRAGGRRYYRPSDMALLGGIKKLLHDDGMTIRGVQKLLREHGVKYVASLSPVIEGVDPIVVPRPVDTPIPPAPMAEMVPQDTFDAPNNAPEETVVPFTRPDQTVSVAITDPVSETEDILESFSPHGFEPPAHIVEEEEPVSDPLSDAFEAPEDAPEPLDTAEAVPPGLEQPLETASDNAKDAVSEGVSVVMSQETRLEMDEASLLPQDVAEAPAIPEEETSRALSEEPQEAPLFDAPKPAKASDPLRGQGAFDFDSFIERVTESAAAPETSELPVTEPQQTEAPFTLDASAQIFPLGADLDLPEDPEDTGTDIPYPQGVLGLLNHRSLSNLPREEIADLLNRAESLRARLAG